MPEDQMPPLDEKDQLIKENKWSYELVTLVLIVLAVAVYFILSGGIGRSSPDLDTGTGLDQSSTLNNGTVVPGESTTQPVVPPSSGSGTLD
jgi:hypothetical protein